MDGWMDGWMEIEKIEIYQWKTFHNSHRTPTDHSSDLGLQHNGDLDANIHRHTHGRIITPGQHADARPMAYEHVSSRCTGKWRSLWHRRIVQLGPDGCHVPPSWPQRNNSNNSTHLAMFPSPVCPEHAVPSCPGLPAAV
jgi:hypothetical protein